MDNIGEPDGDDTRELDRDGDDAPDGGWDEAGDSGGDEVRDAVGSSGSSVGDRGAIGPCNRVTVPTQSVMVPSLDEYWLVDATLIAKGAHIEGSCHLYLQRASVRCHRQQFG